MVSAGEVGTCEERLASCRSSSWSAPHLGPSGFAAVASTCETEITRRFGLKDDDGIIGEIILCQMQHYGRYPENYAVDSRWCSAKGWRLNYTPFPDADEVGDEK